MVRKIIILILIFFSVIPAKSQTEIMLGGIIQPITYDNIGKGIVLGINHKRISITYRVKGGFFATI